MHVLLTATTAVLYGALAIAAAESLPDVGLLLQGVGVGALAGTAVVMWRERRQRRRGAKPETDLRWTLVARWTVLGAVIAVAADLVLRLGGGGS